MEKKGHSLYSCADLSDRFGRSTGADRVKRPCGKTFLSSIDRTFSGWSLVSHLRNDYGDHTFKAKLSRSWEEEEKPYFRLEPMTDIYGYF